RKRTVELDADRGDRDRCRVGPWRVGELHRHDGEDGAAIVREIGKRLQIEGEVREHGSHRLLVRVVVVPVDERLLALEPGEDHPLAAGRLPGLYAEDSGRRLERSDDVGELGLRTRRYRSYQKGRDRHEHTDHHSPAVTHHHGSLLWRLSNMGPRNWRTPSPSCTWGPATGGPQAPLADCCARAPSIRHDGEAVAENVTNGQKRRTSGRVERP